MKTIKELKQEGTIGAGLYSTLYMGATYDDKYRVDVNNQKLGILYGLLYDSKVEDLSINDIFELWTEEEILHWRNMGPVKLKKLKELI